MVDIITSEQVVSNKRIAKNTILLYVRMVLTMLVSLYTSRVILNTLGIEDYGIYNVVGGIVTMFAFLNSAMITSTQRYITYALGKGNMNRLGVVFSTSIHIHAIIALIIIVLAETIGMWFFYNKLVIPDARMNAAMWVLQVSILTMAIQIMNVPFNATIIAHEDMGIFALFSVIETSLKLGIVFLLLLFDYDKLILYAILVACVQFFITLTYILYSHHHYEETHFMHKKDIPLLREMSKFAGWNLWGNLAAMMMGTGLNMMLNMFFGPTINAARAIAVQVESVLSQFSSNFMMAVNPQITILYAKENITEMHKLIFRSSKFSFILLLIISLPIIFEAKTILTLWLKIVPDYTISFLRILLLIMLINITSSPLQTAAAATGKVKRYQSIIGGILLAIVPISYVVLKNGGDPNSVYIVYLLVCSIALIARLLIIKSLIDLSLKQYFFHVILRCTIVFIVSFLISSIFSIILPNGLIYSILSCVLIATIVLIISYTIGLTKTERLFIREKVPFVLKKTLYYDKHN